MKLKSRQDFEASIFPLLTAFGRKNRAAIVNKMYALAAEKEQMEDLKIGLEAQAKVLRRRRLKFNQVRAHIKNARKELLAANSSYPQELPRAVDIQNVAEKLDEMVKRILNIEKTIAGIVHPQLRTAAENRSPGPTPQWRLPALKSTAIEYCFISALDGFFDTLEAEHNVILGPAERNKTISKIFDAAFGEKYEVSRVKTARRRLSERAAIKSQSAGVQKT